MIGCLGDAVVDLSVHLTEPLAPKTDTAAEISTRIGGSALNVAREVARLGAQSRFIGVIGADTAGDTIAAELASTGIQHRGPRTGRTGCVVALMNEHGEASMLTDRASGTELPDWQPEWLDGLAALHVTSYSLFVEPMAATARQLMSAAAERGLLVSLDVSSVGGVTNYGAARYLDLLAQLPVNLLLANRAEADLVLAADDLSALCDLLVVKQGPQPTLLLDRADAEPLSLPVPPVESVSDTLGAGDVFAAGMLVAATEQLRGRQTVDWPEAIKRGQASAQRLLESRAVGRAS